MVDKPVEKPPRWTWAKDVLHSTMARVIHPMKDIEAINHLLDEKGTVRSPTNTHQGVKMHDGKTMVFWSDGSLRHESPILRGKGVRKKIIKMKRERKKVQA